MKITYSTTRNEHYLIYLLFELILVSIVTFLISGFILFYLLGKTDSKTTSNYLDFLFDNPAIYAALCLIPTIISCFFILYYKNRHYIVGFAFDDELKQLTICYRKLMRRRNQEASFPYGEVAFKKFKEKSFLFTQPYEGFSVITREKHTFDFVLNNFIWEKQPLDKKAFIEAIKRAGDFL